MAATARLSLADLNRATLARQHLLERTSRGALEVIEDLVGMQSQAPEPPYTGLWSRVGGFAFDDLSTLITERAATRLLVMRGTVHLLSARDALGLRPLVQPVLERAFAGNHRAVLEAVDAVELAARTREILAEGTPTGRELGERLQAHWPEQDAAELGQLARVRLALVQVPPRGLWGHGGQPAYALADEWLDAPLQPFTPEQLVRRYLAAFGPATVRDCQQWSGLTRLRAAFDALGDELITFDGPSGELLYDLPDAPRPDAATPAPVRLIPQWDNLLLAHADRSRVMTEEHRRTMATKNGMNPAVVLVDGRVAATYRLAKPKRPGTARLEVTPFSPLARADRSAITEEGEALLTAMGEPYAGGEVAFSAPPG